MKDPLDTPRLQEFALLCAERALPVFEKQYPDNMWPRKALGTALEFLVGDATKREVADDNFEAAYAARYVAHHGSCASYAASAVFYAVLSTYTDDPVRAVREAARCAILAAYVPTTPTRAAERDWQRETLLSLVPCEHRQALMGSDLGTFLP